MIFYLSVEGFYKKKKFLFDDNIPEKPHFNGNVIQIDVMCKDMKSKKSTYQQCTS